MKILVAPDKFKSSLSAAEAAEAIARGLRRVDPVMEVDLCPMADGGEGTVDALVAATGGRFLQRRVTGPRPGMKLEARLGMLGDGRTAVIEMAAASGLHLLPPEQRDPMHTTTYGTGELILAAAGAGATRILLGIGGSATVDAGVGCVQACGATIIFDDGDIRGPADAPICGGDIERIARVERPRSCAAPGITIACDVDNPLFGPGGAAPIFGPQKGADPAAVARLDAALEQLARRTGNLSLAHAPGTGAAGGLGFGIMAFMCDARMRPGIDIVIDAVRLRERLAGADLCITAEGRLDAQSLGGKTPIGIARVCRSMGIPCIALAGSIEDLPDAAVEQGLCAWFAITDRPMPLDEAMRQAGPLLERASANLLRLIKAAPRRQQLPPDHRGTPGAE
jgi:glycerate 2-kinase